MCLDTGSSPVTSTMAAGKQLRPFYFSESIVITYSKIATMLNAIFLITSMVFCGKSATMEPDIIVDSIPTIKPVQPIINEASGIADSKRNKGYLWVQEDSGNPAQLYLLAHDGKVKKTIHIAGARNIDWEDMVLAAGDIYLGDIGDNFRINTSGTFYKFPEPSMDVDTVTSFETIRFFYPDGAHDAEAFLVDPVSKDIFIITKRDSPSRIYKISYPYKTNDLNKATAVGTLTYNWVVSAALSPDTKTILVKTYAGVMSYQRSGKESLDKVLQHTPKKQPYQVEPQGEAICFAVDGSGYFTLSEKGGASFVNLYFYSLRK